MGVRNREKRCNFIFCFKGDSQNFISVFLFCFILGLQNKPKKMGHIKADLIDVDLIRGEF